MAEQIILTGKKISPLSEQLTNVTYTASLQVDGYCYFNDEFQYRCLPDGTSLQLFYYNKQIWVLTDNIQDLTPLSFDPTKYLWNLLSGAVAANSTNVPGSNDVEAAVKWLIDKANSGLLTYSGIDENGNPISDRHLGRDGYTYDCSSFVITGFILGGGFELSGASTTASMIEPFTNAGFVWIPGTRWESTQLIRGDIMVNTNAGRDGHTEVYIGNNLDVGCGGYPPYVHDHTPDNYGRSWHGILRYSVLNYINSAGE